jgi:hypothetical protein
MEKDKGNQFEWPSWGRDKGAGWMEEVEPDLSSWMESFEATAMHEDEKKDEEVVADKIIVDEKKEVVADKIKVDEKEVVADTIKVHEKKEDAEKMVLALPMPSLYQSSCDRCVIPPICNMCGVAGDISVFRCWGCRLPVPKDLRHYEACGKLIVTRKYWCKDCATTFGETKCGVCFVCGRIPRDVNVEDEVVPETEE